MARRLVTAREQHELLSPWSRLAMPWRIEHPDYQPADVAHNYNPDMGDTQGGGDSRNFLVAPKNNVWWHGSASGTIGGGDRNIGLHVGDYQTAADNLNAILGPNPNHPQGRWDGKTSLAEAFPDSFEDNGDSIPEIEHSNWQSATSWAKRFTHPDGTPMHGSYRPNVFPVAITGPMGNTTDTAVSDGQAHALMRRQHSRPPKTPKGYYYINAGEGTGVSPETGIVNAASATVPSVDHIQRLDPAKYEHIAQEAHQNWHDYKYGPRRDSYNLSNNLSFDDLVRQQREQWQRALEWRNRRRRDS